MCLEKQLQTENRIMVLPDVKRMKALVLIVLMVGALLLRCGGNSTTPCPVVSCADYATQQAAQAAYDADPRCLDGLDNDNDGIACEHLPSSGSSNCPTTANCGCSGKNKANCASACCKWVTGQGCKCK